MVAWDRTRWREAALSEPADPGSVAPLLSDGLWVGVAAGQV